MTGSAHDFFAAAASVAGALIGLLFVAISVSGDKLAATPGAQVDRIRAQAALTTFLNSLVVSLSALISPPTLGRAAVITSIIGLALVLSSLMSLLRRAHWWRSLREATFLLALLAVLVRELSAGWTLASHSSDTGDVRTVEVLVILCFVIGVARAWELIGAPPSTSIGREASLLLRRRAAEQDQHTPEA